METRPGPIKIEVVRGGFLLTYPVQVNKVAFDAGLGPQQVQGDQWVEEREVFVSPRKLNQKIKEVIDSVGLVRDDQ